MIPGLAIYFHSLATDSRRALVSYWQKYVHLVLGNCVGGQCLPRKMCAFEPGGVGGVCNGVNFHCCQGILLLRIIVGHGHIFSLFSRLSWPRMKYCRKEPLNPKPPTRKSVVGLTDNTNGY